MKNFIAIFLAILMVFTLVGCSSGDKTNDVVDGSTEKNDSSLSENNQSKNNDQGKIPEKENPAENDTQTPEKKTPTIKEQVCFDYEGVKVTAKSVTEHSLMGTGIKILIENNSDRDYTVSTRQVIVNNCMTSSLFSCQVSAGKKANDTLYLSSATLKDLGINHIGQIEIYFRMYDSSSYKTVYETDYTLKTSLYDKMETLTVGAGYELYNEGGIRIFGKHVDENAVLGTVLVLYIENTSGENISVTCEDMSINGYMVTSFLASTVYDGKCAVGNITVLSSSLKENNITDIDTIDLKFRFYSPDTFYTILTTDEISLNLKTP